MADDNRSTATHNNDNTHTKHTINTNNDTGNDIVLMTLAGQVIAILLMKSKYSMAGLTQRDIM